MPQSKIQSPRSNTATAPGKIILAGEHAVVYGRPAIAAPVWEITATATIVDAAAGSGCTINARDINQRIRLVSAPVDEALALVTRLTLQHLGLPANPDWRIDLQSDIPIASGLGSGAAISAALVCAIFAHREQEADSAIVSQIVFESERLFHGTPSGIDNTVIAYGQPVWFIKGQPPELFNTHAPLTLLIADSGIPSPTKETVGDVRRGWQAEPVRYERLFDAIGALVQEIRTAIEAGTIDAIGPLFNRNQAVLQELGVSSPPLDALIDAARTAGALGAKLSGGGRGGNVIALVTTETAEQVQQTLLAAGAKRVIITTV